MYLNEDEKLSNRFGQQSIMTAGKVMRHTDVTELSNPMQVELDQKIDNNNEVLGNFSQEHKKLSSSNTLLVIKSRINKFASKKVQNNYNFKLIKLVI